jgi:hypothetical protein
MANEINLNNGITGLTVTAKLYSGSTQVGSTISLTEVSGALGRYTGSMPSTAAGVYGVLFYSAGSQIGSGKIEWNGTNEVTALVLESDINAITGGGGGGTVTGFSAEALAQLAPIITVVQPLVTINSATGLPMRIEIVQGADYNSTDGTSVSLTMTGTFPAWTGATAYLDIDCGTTLSVTGSITTATGSTRVITFNLTAAQTALLTDATETRNEIVSDVGWFDVRIVLASSSRVMKPVSKAVFVARRPA